MATVRQLPDGTWVDEAGNQVPAPTPENTFTPPPPNPWLEGARNVLGGAGKIALAVPRAAIGIGQAVSGALSSPPEPEPAVPAPAAPGLPPAVPGLAPTTPALPSTGPQLQRTSETVTRTAPTRAEAGLEKQLQTARGAELEGLRASASTAEEQALAKRAGAAGAEAAGVKAQEAEDVRRTTEELQAQEDRMRAATEVARSEAVALSKAEYDKYASKKPRDYWDVPTERKLGRLLGIALGGIGAAIAKENRNVALDVIDKMQDRHDAQERFLIEQQRQKWLDSRMAVDDVNKRYQAELTDFAHRRAGRIASIRALAEEKLAGLGRTTAEISQDATVLGLKRQEQQALNQAQRLAVDNVEKDLQREVSKRAQVTSTKQLVDPGLGGKGAGAGRLSASEAQEIADLDQDIQKLDRLSRVIGTAPRGWDEYRGNQESWARKEKLSGTKLGALRAGAQALGLADVAPEQGLKSESARFIHRGMSELTTTVAKKGGGVVTGADRQAAASEMAVLGTRSAKEQAETLQRIRRDLEAKRNHFLQLRGLAPATPQQPAPAQPQGQQGVPVKVRSKRTGQIIDAIQMPDGRIVAAGGG